MARHPPIDLKGFARRSSDLRRSSTEIGDAVAFVKVTCRRSGSASDGYRMETT